MNKDDFVFETDNVGNLTAGGYKINSKLFNNQMAMKTVNYKTGGATAATIGAGTISDVDKNIKVSSLFSNLAVPAGLLVLTNNPFNTHMNSKCEGKIDDTLYDKLLSLTNDKTVTNILKRKFTKKHGNKIKRKKTMKNT